MPARLKIRVMGGRNLPVMDKSSDTSDAFVEVKIGNFSGKTEVCRHSLNPVWNSEWFKFEIPDEELQDEPLQIRIMDYDTYSANDAIGKVYVNLSPLLFKECGHTMWGFYPIYDTMHGTRGDLGIVIKMEPFSNSNKFRQTSCGVRFFYSPIVPYGYYCTAILGFVEELVVNDDPEYQWIDKIRTPRASNEARQTLFYKLSGEVQRKIGIKALELGGNAVLGYQLYFDLEGESGVVVRGIGTSVILKKIAKYSNSNLLNNLRQNTSSLAIPNENNSSNSSTSPKNIYSNSNDNLNNSNTSLCINKLKESSSPIPTASIGIHRQNSSELEFSPSFKQTNMGFNFGINMNQEDLNTASTPEYKFMMSADGLHSLEYPFITMKQFPLGLIKHIGGVVSSRSVKYLAQLNSPEDPETRDAWWMELRKEIRSHCKLLECNAVLGYTETSCICDDVVILSVSGTAALLNTKKNDSQSEAFSNSPSPNFNNSNFFDQNVKTSDTSPSKIKTDPLNANSNQANNLTSNRLKANCSLCHVPYSEQKVIFGCQLSKCSICKTARVPDVVFLTIEPPSNIPSIGTGCLIQARVFRNKKDTRGDTRAKELSDSLPFLEYEMHKQLLSKLKMKGMNAIFGLSIQISVGENMLIAVATGTAVYLTPLPNPTPPQVSSSKNVRVKKLNDIQRIISDLVVRNKERYGLSHINNSVNQSQNSPTNQNLATNNDLEDLVSNESSDDEKFTFRNKNLTTKQLAEQCVILEVDDSDDADIISLMIDSEVPKSFEIINTDYPMPGNESFLSIYQSFSKVFRAKITSTKQFSTQFDWMIQSLLVKLRRLTPCALAGLKFKVDAPEADMIQITILGTVVGIRKLNDSLVCKNGISLYLPTHCYQDKKSRSSIDSELFLENDEDACEKLELPTTISSVYDLPNRGNPSCVELTSLSHLPKCTIVKYIGNLTFPFIRETTSIRECGGLNGFLSSFLNEVLLIVRTHIVGLDGNALVSMNITQLVLLHNPHKNQAQCLIIISGDVVKANYVKFFKTDEKQENFKVS